MISGHVMHTIVSLIRMPRCSKLRDVLALTIFVGSLRLIILHMMEKAE